MLEDVLGPRGGKRTGAPLHHGRLPVFVLSSVHTFLLPSFPYTLDCFFICAHQGVMESLGVWIDGGLGVADSPCCTNIHSFKSLRNLCNRSTPSWWTVTLGGRFPLPPLCLIFFPDAVPRVLCVLCDHVYLLICVCSDCYDPTPRPIHYGRPAPPRRVSFLLDALQQAAWKQLTETRASSPTRRDAGRLGGRQ